MGGAGAKNLYTSKFNSNSKSRGGGGQAAAVSPPIPPVDDAYGDAMSVNYNMFLDGVKSWHLTNLPYLPSNEVQTQDPA